MKNYVLAAVLFVYAGVVTVLLVLVAVTSAHTAAETRDLIVSGNTPAARLAERAARKAQIFDTYTHAILCDSLLINKKELIGRHSLEVVVEAMLNIDCKGVTLP